MKSREQIIEIVKEQGIITLFYHDDVDVSIAVVNALYNAGIRVVEYTNRGSAAISTITWARFTIPRGGCSGSDVGDR